VAVHQHRVEFVMGVFDLVRHRRMSGQEGTEKPWHPVGWTQNHILSNQLRCSRRDLANCWADPQFNTVCKIKSASLSLPPPVAAPIPLPYRNRKSRRRHEDQGFAVDHKLSDAVFQGGLTDPGETARPVIVTAGDQPHAVAVTFDANAKTVLLDFVEPLGTSRDFMVGRQNSNA
jgi:hypothetical protein